MNISYSVKKFWRFPQKRVRRKGDDTLLAPKFGKSSTEDGCRINVCGQDEMEKKIGWPQLLL